MHDDYGTGIIIRAGKLPDSGASVDEGQPPIVPPPYIILDHALRAIRADSLDALQRDTVNGGAPTYNTAISTAEWFRRFEVSNDELLGAKAATLNTPRLTGQNAIPSRV